MINYQSEKFAIMEEQGKAFRKEFMEMYEERRIAALPFPNPINRKQRRANIAQERKWHLMNTRNLHDQPQFIQMNVKSHIQHLDFVVKLVKLPQRLIVASHTFESVSDANMNSMGSIVGPFDQALGKTLKGVVAWALRNGEKAALQREA